MFARQDKPWWKQPNNFYMFDELKNFKRGAMGFNPSNAQEQYMNMILAGYVNDKHEQPKSLGKKSK